MEGQVETTIYLRGVAPDCAYCPTGARDYQPLLTLPNKCAKMAITEYGALWEIDACEQYKHKCDCHCKVGLHLVHSCVRILGHLVNRQRLLAFPATHYPP